jgi:hypothetical protein
MLCSSFVDMEKSRVGTEGCLPNLTLLLSFAEISVGEVHSRVSVRWSVAPFQNS